jgi:uracil-DNA glycosylase
MNIRELMAMLTSVQLDNVFNPYVDVCPLHDQLESPRIRHSNLRAFMKAAETNGCDSIWFGRDLGYRGGRRTGLALTDEAHLSTLSHTYSCNGIRKATVTPSVAERTATEIWRMLEGLPTRPFLWNAFPFHPHKPGEPMTNRCFTARELNAAREILDGVLAWLRPKTVIALGNDAVRVLATLGVEAQYVRHPSYGGQADFVRGVCDIFGVPSLVNRQPALI